VSSRFNASNVATKYRRAMLTQKRTRLERATQRCWRSVPTVRNMAHTQPYQRAKRIVDSVLEVLYKDRFTVNDLTGSYQDTHATVMKIRRADAVSVVDETEVADKTGRMKLINVYAWRPEIQGRLQQYVEERNDLPCSCRAHVPPERDENGLYICKHCGAKHTQDVIKNAL